MKLQKGKWYVCIDAWSDDGWNKFMEGDLVQCEKDDVMTDYYGKEHMFKEEDKPERIFREANDVERNIASATEVNMDEFMDGIGYFVDKRDTLADIYRHGAEAMLRHIKSQMSIKV